MIEKQVTSLDLSQQLKEAGYLQEGYFWWVKNHIGNFHMCRKSRDYFIEIKNDAVAFHSDKYYVAPTVAELGERLPGYLLNKTGLMSHCLEIEKHDDLDKIESWYICYQPVEDNKKAIEAYASTEADARAKIYLHLKKKGVLK